MMGTLSLFPVRVPIGQWTDDAQNSYDVLMTPEFARALSDLFARVGGANGVNMDDLERLVALSEIAPVVTEQEASQIQQQDEFGVAVAAVASMAGKLSELEAKLEAVESTNARLAKLEA